MYELNPSLWHHICVGLCGSHNRFCTMATKKELKLKWFCCKNFFYRDWLRNSRKRTPHILVLQPSVTRLSCWLSCHSLSPEEFIGLRSSTCSQCKARVSFGFSLQFLFVFVESVYVALSLSMLYVLFLYKLNLLKY